MNLRFNVKGGREGGWERESMGLPGGYAASPPLCSLLPQNRAGDQSDPQHRRPGGHTQPPSISGSSRIQSLAGWSVTIDTNLVQVEGGLHTQPQPPSPSRLGLEGKGSRAFRGSAQE